MWSHILELLVVSVNKVNDPRQKVHNVLWYQPTDNSVALDNLLSILEDLDISVFFYFYLFARVINNCASCSNADIKNG